MGLVITIMYISILLYTFMTFTFCYSSATEIDTCSANSDKCARESNGKSKYSKELNVKFQKYLNLIQKAKQNYVPCNNTRCGCYSPGITNDLDLFSTKRVSKDAIRSMQSKGTRYQIINHQLFREKNCLFPARCSGVEHFLLELSPKLPDTEFILNTRDWPQVHKNYDIIGPVFSFSKTNDYHDIMFPAWSFWEGGPAISLYPRGIGRWDNHRVQLGKLGNSTTWENKIGKAFFRGSRTSSERDALVLLSREKPELVDAQYTKNQAWKSDKDTLRAPPADEVSFEDHCKYKYLFNFRGVAASFRFKHILLCKSLVFHVGNEWLEFFYLSLKPWIHYIPVDANASKESIKELLEFVSNHELLAKEIAENGYNMIWNNLKLADVSCYWNRLLRKYSKILSYKPILDPDLIEIKQK